MYSNCKSAFLKTASIILSRNFALNLDNGLKVTAFYRKKKKNGSRTVGRNGNKDVELVGLIGYCTKLAKEVDDFRDVDFKYWKDVVNGTKDLITKKRAFLRFVEKLVWFTG